MAEFERNQLDDYNLSTYHIKLFMLPEKQASGTTWDSKDGIIIAESGVTGQMLINEVDFTSYITLNGKTRNSTSVDFNISLREFSGATLMDSIFLASLELGVRNYMKAPYFLEITFRARDVNTGAAVTPAGLKWTWPLTIESISTEVDSGGSTYDIRAHHYNHMGQKESFARIDKALSLDNVSTVKEATDKLMEAMTKRGEDKSATTYSLPDEYVISFPKYKVGTDEDGKDEITDMGTFKLRKTDTTNSDKSGDTTTMSATSISIEKGKTIMDAINSIVSSTEEYQKMIKQSETADDEAPDGKKIKVLHKVDTTVKQISYDVARGDYQRKFTFEIFPYHMGTLVTSPNELNEDNSTVRYKWYKDRGLVAKHYNYLFTGENDQVLEFNLKFDQAWFVNMPSQGGLFTQHNMGGEPQHFSKEYADFLKLRKEIMEAVKNMPNTSAGAKETTADLSAKIDTNDSLTPEQKIQLNNLLRTKTQSRLPVEEKSTYNENLSKRQDSGVPLTSNTPSSRFVSDYRREEALKSANALTTYRLLPISYREDNSKEHDTNVTGVESSAGGGRQYVNSLLSQAFSGRSGDLANLEMKIKGDPYWLGPSGSDGIIPKGSKAAQVFLLFTTNTPTVPNESTGVTSNRPTTMNGLYGVKSAHHSFSGGMFTQTLSCVREPLVEISQIKDIDNNE